MRIRWRSNWQDVEKSPSFVLASRRDSTYCRGYASPHRLLRPSWKAFLNILLCVPVSSDLDLYQVFAPVERFFNSLLGMVRIAGTVRRVSA